MILFILCATDRGGECLVCCCMSCESCVVCVVHDVCIACVVCVHGMCLVGGVHDLCIVLVLGSVLCLSCLLYRVYLSSSSTLAG